MTVEFRCRDVGVACRHVTRAETAGALLDAVGEHAEARHGVTLNDTLRDYAATRVRPARG